MGVIASRIGRRGRAQRENLPLSFQNWVEMFKYGGVGYGVTPLMQTMPGKQQEEPLPSFEGFLRGVYKQNGIIFACMLARMMIFSEARFQYRRRVNGRPGELFGDKSLAILEKPWPNATTGDLLSRTIQDADLAGNFFCVRRPGPRIRRMRPDWVDIIIGSTSDKSIDSWDVDADVIGYGYWPGGRNSGRDVEVFLPEEVSHFAPIPDPMMTFRGMSWITPVVREVMGDAAATEHKLAFFEHGATPNLVVRFPQSVELDQKKLDKYIADLEEKHAGLDNAYKTLYLAGGADVTIVGKDMKELDFKVTQGAGETRIAAAARVPPIMVGLSEGLDAATYSNYGQARRAFADGTLRPLWRNAAGSYSPMVTVPGGSELWYDDRDIPFLQEDLKDQATVMQISSSAVLNLVNAGYDPKSIVAAIASNDITRLLHTGLYSVQLQPAGTTFTPTTPPEQPPLPGEPAKPPALPPAKKPAAALPARTETRPVGPFPTFAACVAHMVTEQGYDEEQAQHICGAMEQPGENGGRGTHPPAPAPPVVVQGLSARERDVALAVVRGRTNKQIARELGLSERTVEHHVSSALAKIDGRTRTDLAVWVLAKVT